MSDKDRVFGSKGSFPSLWPSKKKKEQEKSELKSRAEKEDGLPPTPANAMPSNTGEPGLQPQSPRASTTTPTTTVTATTAATTTTTTVLASTLTTTTTSTQFESAWDNPRIPRPHWLHYYKSEDQIVDDQRSIAGRGKARIEDLNRMKQSLEKEPDELFRKNASKPVSWLQEFRLVAEPAWRELLQSMEEQSERPEVKLALANPDQNLDCLEQSFARVIDAWAGIGQEAFAQTLTPAMKAMASELLDSIRQAQNSQIKAGKKKPGKAFGELAKDLLVFSLIDSPQAPQAYSRLFGNYLAGFLGRDPTQPQLFRLPLDVLAGRINVWRVPLAATYADFDPAQALMEAARMRPVQKFALLPGSDNFADIIKEPMAKLTSAKTLYGMSPIVNDYRFSPPLRRDLQGTLPGSSQGPKVVNWYERKEDKLTRLTGNLDAMHNVLHKCGPQGTIADALCTQAMWAFSNQIMFGMQEESSPFKDASQRAVIPTFLTFDTDWIIERLEDDTLEITCDFQAYGEQVKVLVPETPKPAKKDEAPAKPVVITRHERLVLPGWYRSQTVVQVSPNCVVKVIKLSAQACNLHLTEEGYPPREPEEAVEEKSRSPRKRLQRLSQKFQEPFNFSVEKREEKVKAKPAPPTSSSSRSGSESPPQKAELADSGSSPKVREKQKEREKEEES